MLDEVGKSVTQKVRQKKTASYIMLARYEAKTPKVPKRHRCAEKAYPDVPKRHTKSAESAQNPFWLRAV